MCSAQETPGEDRRPRTWADGWVRPHLPALPHPPSSFQHLPATRFPALSRTSLSHTRRGRGQVSHSHCGGLAPEQRAQVWGVKGLDPGWRVGRSEGTPVSPRWKVVKTGGTVGGEPRWVKAVGHGVETRPDKDKARTTRLRAWKMGDLVAGAEQTNQPTRVQSPDSQFGTHWSLPSSLQTGQTGPRDLT